MKFIKSLAVLLSCSLLSVSAQEIEVFSNDISVSRDKRTYTYIGDVEIHFSKDALIQKKSNLVKYGERQIEMSGDVVVTFVSGVAYADSMKIKYNGDKHIASAEQVVIRVSKDKQIEVTDK